MHKLIATVLVLIFMLLCEMAEAGSLFRAAVRSTTRSAERQAERTVQIERAFVRDAVRDAATPAKATQSVRRVQRYTSAAQAQRELSEGIAPGSHMTPNVARGRGINSTTASQRYGLTEKPERVLTVEIPSGTNVRTNKAMGGSPGRGELTATERIPASAVKSVRPVAQESYRPLNQ